MRLIPPKMSSSTASRALLPTLTPFLYPCLDVTWSTAFGSRLSPSRRRLPHSIRCHATATAAVPSTTNPPPRPSTTVDVHQYDHLDPQPPEHTTQSFTDSCILNLHAGAGGHGCIAFLREKYIEHGPPNGGDGGTGGNVYIQAVQGETSLHKLARRSILKADRGRNGQGDSKGGKRGEDLLITVPVGTVVREISRIDPVLEHKEERGFGRDLPNDPDGKMDVEGTDQAEKWQRDKWLIYPGTLPRAFSIADFPALPRPRHSHLAATQPPSPIHLDLDQPMDTPILLAAGAMGGLGNPHFVTKSLPRPKFATKGDAGPSVRVQLELKIIADVGLVGLPNAGKSTLLRALTRSRTRVGDWPFTTLSPHIGTVVLDSYRGRPSRSAAGRPNFTIADIPGLIEDAHLDRGLGLGFLRHIERAGVLAFVLDLSAGDAVAALHALWREVAEYQRLREHETNADSQRVIDSGPAGAPHHTYRPFSFPASSPSPTTTTTTTTVLPPSPGRPLPRLPLAPISTKPWLVVATKADLPDTQANFAALQRHLRDVQEGACPHPSAAALAREDAGDADARSSRSNVWKGPLRAVPVCAMRKEGVEAVREAVLALL